MKNFERAPWEKEEKSIEQMSGEEKFEAILPLFADQPHCNHFIEVSKEYAALRKRAHGNNNDAENYKPHIPHSTPGQANAHNYIMKALQGLSLNKEATPLQRSILNEMAVKAVAGQVVKDWVAAHENDEDDEDEDAKNRKNMSEVAYYHNKGREH